VFAAGKHLRQKRFEFRHVVQNASVRCRERAASRHKLREDSHSAVLFSLRAGFSLSLSLGSITAGLLSCCYLFRLAAEFIHFGRFFARLTPLAPCARHSNFARERRDKPLIFQTRILARLIWLSNDTEHLAPFIAEARKRLCKITIINLPRSK